MTVELGLERKEYYPDRVIGGFYDETGSFRWFTLEPTDRKLESGGVKILGKTAIPRGSYHLILAWSVKHNALTPLLLAVPQFVGEEIHVGNTPENTEGCVLIGRKYDGPSHQIYESVLACSEFYPYLLEKIIESNDDVWLTVS